MVVLTRLTEWSISKVRENDIVDVNFDLRTLC